MTNPEVKIKTDGVTGTEIFVNGKKLEGVTGFAFKQTHKDNSGLPVLQIDLKATHVELDAKILPALPETFKNHYLSVDALLDSGKIEQSVVEGICRECGIEL